MARRAFSKLCLCGAPAVARTSARFFCQPCWDLARKEAARFLAREASRPVEVEKAPPVGPAAEVFTVEGLAGFKARTVR